MPRSRRRVGAPQHRERVFTGPESAFTANVVDGDRIEMFARQFFPRILLVIVGFGRESDQETAAFALAECGKTSGLRTMRTVEIRVGFFRFRLRELCGTPVGHRRSRNRDVRTDGVRHCGVVQFVARL